MKNLTKHLLIPLCGMLLAGCSLSAPTASGSEPGSEPLAQSSSVDSSFQARVDAAQLQNDLNTAYVQYAAEAVDHVAGSTGIPIAHAEKNQLVLNYQGKNYVAASAGGWIEYDGNGSFMVVLIPDCETPVQAWELSTFNGVTFWLR